MYLTEARADRLEIVLARASASRTAHIARLADNPLGIELRSFGQTVQARMISRDLAYYPNFSGSLDLRSDADDNTVAELVA